MRPLKYDPQFQSLMNNNLKENFLFLFRMKVPDSMMRKYSLQQGIMIIGFISLFFDFLFLIFKKTNNSFEKYIIYFDILFNLIAFHVALTLKCFYAKLYYYWRIILIFIFPYIEYFNFYRYNICFIFSYYCNIYFIIIGILFFEIVNLYFIRIIWALYNHLYFGNYLLAINGCSLFNLLEKENIRIEIERVYKPPVIETITKNPKIELKIFNNEKKEENPFAKAMEQLKKEKEKK